jgi:hypothetical protein
MTTSTVEVLIVDPNGVVSTSPKLDSVARAQLWAEGAAAHLFQNARREGAAPQTFGYRTVQAGLSLPLDGPEVLDGGSIMVTRGPDGNPFVNTQAVGPLFDLEAFFTARRDYQSIGTPAVAPAIEPPITAATARTSKPSLWANRRAAIDKELAGRNGIV